MQAQLKLILILLTSSMILTYCTSSKNEIHNDHGNDIRKFIESGDIIRTEFADSSVINLYQGNGRFGCSFGKTGLHVHPGNLPGGHKYGKTQLMHIQHFTRAKYGSDYMLPLARLYWQNIPDTILSFKQHQKIYDGLIETRFETEKGEYDCAVQVREVGIYQANKYMSSRAKPIWLKLNSLCSLTGRNPVQKIQFRFLSNK